MDTTRKNKVMLSASDFSPEAVIVGAGEFPSHPLPLKWLEGCPRVVCCDGAADRYLQTGLPIWRIVGDCDSLSPENSIRYAPIIRKFADQETNDQTKAATYLKRKGFTHIAIVAATGMREDHTLGNISLLIDYMRQGIDARIYTDYGVFIPVSGDASFQCPAGTQVSIFSFGATGLRAEGLRYPLHDFTSWWQGTLNETLSDSFSIKADGDYLVFLNYA